MTSLRPRSGGLRRFRPYRYAAAISVLLVVGGVAFEAAARSGTDAPPPRSTTTSTTTTTTTTTTTSTTTTTTAPPPSVPMAIAPLTGLPVPATDLLRPALVAKIDGSLPAMPQEGLSTADVVYEVRIEWGSRYLGLWHSKAPPRIGPLRSARTTDLDLLAMLGHPLFAYSGANPGVRLQLAASPWKTDATQSRARGAYSRDQDRPWHNSLMAEPDKLWEVATPGVAPLPLFDYHAADAIPPGVAAGGVTANPGMLVDFLWDGALGAWRRKAWWQDHMLADGSPVAPTNVVVLEMPYQQAQVDLRSPEALSVGAGRAWVFTRGTVRAGRWIRWHRFDRWNLHDAFGSPITLDPGTTWVVMAEEPPQIRPPG